MSASVAPKSQGYWKNRPAEWPSQYSPSAQFYVSGQTWLQVINSNSSSGQWVNLATQFIAAKLNVANGAQPPADVAAAIAEAETLLSTTTAKTKLSRAEQQHYVRLAKVLDDWNKSS